MPYFSCSIAPTSHLVYLCTVEFKETTSSKGKGILLKDDGDEPIQLPDQADEHLIREYSLSLIDKIFNPKKKQNVERLIAAMPEHWGMS